MPKNSNTDPKPQCVQTDVSKSVIFQNGLRIGNLFENVIITSISEEGYNYSNYPEIGVYWKTFDTLKPIIVAEELLLNYGFENGIDEMTLCTDKICVYWRKFENHFEINGEKYFIEDFHIFQNLFFFLSGSELTVC